MSEKATSIPEEQEREAFEAWRRRVTKIKNNDEAVARHGLGHDAHYVNQHTKMMWYAWQKRASLAATERQDSQALPDGWVPLTIAWDADYPEEVAYGPKIMMDRLKKWLDKFYALRIASQALPEQPSGVAESHIADLRATSRDAISKLEEARTYLERGWVHAAAVQIDFALSVLAARPTSAANSTAPMQPTPGFHELSEVVRLLREQGRYEDEEGEATNKLADLLAALAAPTQAGGEAFECERCGLPQSQHTATHWCDNQSFAGPNGEVILGVHGGRAIAAAPAAAPTQALPEQPSDHDLMQALEERDRYHDMADDLAAQIAAITGEEIGEHSSANDPWRNAMLAADEFIAKLLRKLLTPPAPMQPSELVTQFESAVNACTRYHTEYMGKAMPDREYERFARLRDETIPRLRAALNAALAAPTQAAPAAQESIRIDFRQATDLLAMFGGEPAEITLALWGDEGHDGPGLYAWYTDYPEVGTKLYAAAPAAAVAPSEDYQKGFADGAGIYRAYRIALERAAQVCDSVNNHDNPMTANDCADAIRALQNPALERMARLDDELGEQP